MGREFEIDALSGDLADKVSSWVELVGRAGDEHMQDRVLLECVLALGSAQAAALWRPARAGHDAPWRVVLARGPSHVLPGPGPFEALRARTLPATAIPGVRVFAGRGVALALGGLNGALEPKDDERLDLVEALLFTYELMDTRAGDETIAPPLPARPRESTEARRLRHDINNVLTSLRATEELLERFSDGLSSEETTRFRAVVEHECARVGELLASALRTDARAGADACSPAAVVEQVLDAERAACEQAHIRVQRFVEPAVRPVSVSLASADLARLVQNLIVNAREANRGRADANLWVTLELESAPVAGVRLTVEDDGPGLESTALERVFEPGFSTKNGAAAGQGLAIVRALAEQAGGSARAGVRALGGVRFEVRIPSCSAVSSPRGAVPPAQADLGA